MPRFFNRAAGLLVLLTTAALSACAGGISPTPPGSSLIPTHVSPSVSSVVLTVVDGAKKIGGAKTLLFICTDAPFCLKRDKVLSRGTTNAKGQSTLKGSFTSNDLVCAEANWTGSIGSHSFDRTSSRCTNNFPNAITLNFSGR